MSVRRVALVSVSASVLSLGLVAALGAGAACTHDREDPPPPIDAPKPDAQVGGEVLAQELTVLDPVKGIDIEPDLGCAASGRPDAGPIFPPEAGVEAGTDAGDDAEAPDTSMGTDSGSSPIGTLVEKQVELVGFGSGGSDKLANQDVDVYYGNTFAGAPNITVRSDAAGLFKVMLPQGLRVSYHVRKSSLLGDYYALDDLHEAFPLPDAGPGPVRWQGVTLERQNTLALAITGTPGYAIKPGTGIIAGRVMDCKRRYIQHARVLLVDYTDNAMGAPMTFGRCGDGLCRVYLSDAELPDIGRQATSRASLFTMVDVPIGRKLRLEAHGLVKGVDKLVAWRNLEVKEFGIATHLLEPDAAPVP